MLLFSKSFFYQSLMLMVVRAKYEQFTLVFINAYAPNTAAERGQLLNELSEEFLFELHREPHAASQHVLKQLLEQADSTPGSSVGRI